MENGKTIIFSFPIIIISKRGPNRRSYIGGKSDHNQRVERLWRDLFHGCSGFMYDLFTYMEE